MSEQHEYIKEYVEALPFELRPEVNERLKEALRDAWRNGWTASYLAQLVAKSNFQNAHNPAAVALTRLERFSKEKFTFHPNNFMPTFTDAHCRFKNCQCTHENCYRGWIDGFTRPVAFRDEVVHYDYTKPCPVCRSELVERLNTPSFSF